VLNGFVFLVLFPLLVSLPQRGGQRALNLLLSLLDAGLNPLLLLTLFAVFVFRVLNTNKIK
jgi:hypothetical protein